jgi:anti-anti-sigma factor
MLLMSSDGYLIAKAGEAVYIRALGLANMKNAPVLDAFLRSEMDARVEHIFVDLSECKGMDSTFMGTLVGSSHRLQGQGGRLVLVNPSVGNRRSLDMLGVSAVIPVVDNHAVPDATFVRLDAEKALSPIQKAEYMRKAHEELVRLGDENRAKFEPFLAAIDADIERMRGAAEG